MKKLIILLVLVVLAFGAKSQSAKGRVFSITPDTLTKVETEYFVVSVSGSYKSLALTTLFTQLGGTSDGSAIMEVSVDGISYYTINEESGKYHFMPNDTLTITDGAVWNIVITDPAFKYYRIAATGTVSDTTLVSPKYMVK